MSIARNLINTVNEQVGKTEPKGAPITDVGTLKVGSKVIFKASHRYEGMIGLVSSFSIDNQTVDVRLGSANVFAAPKADLLMVEACSKKESDDDIEGDDVEGDDDEEDEEGEEVEGKKRKAKLEAVQKALSTLSAAVGDLGLSEAATNLASDMIKDFQKLLVPQSN